LFIFVFHKNLADYFAWVLGVSSAAAKGLGEVDLNTFYFVSKRAPA
jgi:hypothetical protein